MEFESDILGEFSESFRFALRGNEEPVPCQFKGHVVSFVFFVSRVGAVLSCAFVFWTGRKYCPPRQRMIRAREALLKYAGMVVASRFYREDTSKVNNSSSSDNSRGSTMRNVFQLSYETIRKPVTPYIQQPHCDGLAFMRLYTPACRIRLAPRSTSMWRKSILGP